MREEYVRLYGTLTIDQCMEVWERCECEGKDVVAGRVSSSRKLRADDDKDSQGLMVGSCGETEGQRACTKGACSDLFEIFNSQLLYFCPPPGGGESLSS